MTIDHRVVAVRNGHLSLVVLFSKPDSSVFRRSPQRYPGSVSPDLRSAAGAVAHGLARSQSQMAVPRQRVPPIAASARTPRCWLSHPACSDPKGARPTTMKE